MTRQRVGLVALRPSWRSCASPSGMSARQSTGGKLFLPPFFFSKPLDVLIGVVQMFAEATSG